MPPRVRISSPGRVAGAAAHLAALGVVGPAVFTALFGLFGSGFGLLPALLLGVVVLVALVYALFAVAWFERARVDGLYRLGLAPIRPRRSPKQGFVGVLHTIWLQAIDPLQWRAVASFAIATVLGLLTITALGVVSWGIGLVVSPVFGWSDTRLLGILPLPGIAAPLTGAAAVVVASVPSSGSRSCTASSCGRSSFPPAKPSSSSRPAPPTPVGPAPSGPPRSSAPASSAICTTACSRGWCRSA